MGWKFRNVTGRTLSHGSVTMAPGAERTFDDVCELVAFANASGVGILQNANGGAAERINREAEARGCGRIGVVVPPSGDSEGEDGPVGPNQADTPQQQGAPNPQPGGEVGVEPGTPEETRQPTEAAHDPAAPASPGEIQDGAISGGAGPGAAADEAERARRGDPPPGEEDRAHGTDRTDAPARSGDPVDLSTGRLSLTAVDLEVPTPFLPLRMERVYRSGFPHFGPFGFNWDHSWNVYLRPLNDGRIGRWNGRLHEDVFVPNGEGYDPPRGVFERLEAEPGPGVGFSIVARGGIRMRFERPPQWTDAERIPLVEMTDRAGNAIRLDYDAQNRVRRVADDDGRALLFTYGECGRLERVADDTGRTVVYGHDDAAEHLSCVVLPHDAGGEDDATTFYEYDYSADHPARRHNVLRVFDGRGNQLLRNRYGTDPSSWTWNRVVEQTVGDDVWYFDYTELQWLPPDDVFVNEPVWQTCVIGPDRVLRTYTFNFRGDLIDERYRLVADGSYRVVATRQRFDSQGNLVQLMRADGSRVEMRFDHDAANPCDRGNLRRVELRPPAAAPLGSRIVYRASYEPRFQQLLEEIDESGARTRFRYDPDPGGFGALTRIDWPDATLPDGSVQSATTTFDTNARGQVDVLVTPEGIRNEITHEGAGSRLAGFPIAATLDAAGIGETTQFGYSVEGFRNEVVEPDGAVTRSAYDPQGRLVEVLLPSVDGDECRWQWSYGHHGHVIEVRRPRGAFDDGAIAGDLIVDRYDRDPVGRLLAVVQGANTAQPRQSVFTIDHAGRRLREVDPAGTVTKRKYDERGLLLAETTASETPAEIGQRLVYDRTGRLVRVHLPGGGRIDHAYDAWGRPVTRTGSDGTELRVTFGPGDRLEATEVFGDPGDGSVPRALRRVRAEHDERGRLVRSTLDVFDDDPASATPLVGTSWFDREGRRRRYVGPRGDETTTQYDGLSRPVVVTDPVGNSVATTYGPAERVIRTVRHDQSPAGVVTSWIEQTYDARGRLRRTETSAGTTSLVHPDARDLPVTTIDENGVETSRTFGLGGELTSMVVDPSGLAVTHSITHDAAGREIGYVDPSGAVATIERDAAGRETRVELAPGYWTAQEWGPDGRVARSLRSDGAVVDYTRDVAGRVTQMTTTAGAGLDPVPPHSFRYDGLGRRVRAAAGAASVTWRFDSLDRVVAETGPLGTSRRRFDDLQSALLVEWPHGRVERHEWDALGRVAAIGLVAPSAALPGGAPGDVLARFDYRGPLRIAEVSFGSGASTTSEYDDVGRLVGTTHADASGSTVSSTFTSHDPVGRRRLETIDGAPALTNRLYRYRSSGEVAQWAEGFATTTSPHADQPAQDADVAAGEVAAASATLREDLTYDAAGARTSLTRVSPAGSATTTFTRGVLHRLDAIDAVPVAHDGAGRRVADDRYSYRYDALGRVAAISGPAGPIATFTYDPAGRVATRVDADGSSEVGYLAGLPLLERSAGGVTVERTFHSGIITPVGETRSPGWFGWHVGPHNDLVAVTDATGAAAEAYRYEPFGTATILDPVTGSARAASAIGHAPVFGASPALRGTDLFFAPARLYDPRTGLFCAPDPRSFLGGADPFAYAANDPLNYIDPSGEIAPLVVIGVMAGIGALLGGGAAWWSGGDGWDILAGATIGAVVGGVGGWLFAPLAAAGTATVAAGVSWVGLGGTAAGGWITSIGGTALGGLATGIATGSLSGSAHGAWGAYRRDGDIASAAWEGAKREAWAGGVSGLVTGGMFGGLMRVGAIPPAMSRPGVRSNTGMTAFRDAAPDAATGVSRRAAMMPEVVGRGMASPWGLGGAGTMGFAGGYSAQVTRDVYDGKPLSSALENSWDEGLQGAVLSVAGQSAHPVTWRYWQTRTSLSTLDEVARLRVTQIDGISVHHQRNVAQYPEFAYPVPRANQTLPWLSRLSNQFARPNVSGRYSQFSSEADHQAWHRLWGTEATTGMSWTRVPTHGPFTPAWNPYLPPVDGRSSDEPDASKPQ